MVNEILSFLLTNSNKVFLTHWFQNVFTVGCDGLIKIEISNMIVEIRKDRYYNMQMRLLIIILTEREGTTAMAVSSNHVFSHLTSTYRCWEIGRRVGLSS